MAITRVEDIKITEEDRRWATVAYAQRKGTAFIITTLLERIGADPKNPDFRTRMRSHLRTCDPKHSQFAKKYQEIYDKVSAAWKESHKEVAVYYRQSRIQYVQKMIDETMPLFADLSDIEETQDRIKSHSDLVRTVNNLLASARAEGDIFDMKVEGVDDIIPPDHKKRLLEEADDEFFADD